MNWLHAIVARRCAIAVRILPAMQRQPRNLWAIKYFLTLASRHNAQRLRRVRACDCVRYAHCARLIAARRALIFRRLRSVAARSGVVRGVQCALIALCYQYSGAKLCALCAPYIACQRVQCIGNKKPRTMARRNRQKKTAQRGAALCFIM